MLLHKPFGFAAAAILLLAISPASAVLAQQTRAGQSSSKPAEAPANANSKPEAAANQTAAPVPDKNANDRLPFMAETERENQQAAPSATGLLFRTLGALLLIVGLIVAAAWGMKRFGGARFGAPKEDAPDLAILNSIGLGERRSVAIVRFGRRTLLIGSTPQSVTLLAETESEAVAPRIQSVGDILSEAKDLPFAEQLNTASGRLGETEWKNGEGVQW